MSNNTIYPYGTDGELPSSIGIINDLVTGGSNMALSAEQGKVLNTTISQSEKDVVENLGNIKEAEFSLLQGGLNPSTGEFVSTTIRIYTENYIDANYVCIESNGSKVYVFGYNENGILQSSVGWITDSRVVHIDGATNYRLVFGASDDSDITPSDYNSLDISISIVGKLADKDDVPEMRLEYDGVADLSICDEDKNELVRFQDGHIKTKFFDSSKNGSNSEILSTILYQEQGNPFGQESEKYYRRGVFRMNQSYQPLIIVVGQSNADGRAPYSTAPQWLVSNNYGVPNYKVYDTATGNFLDYNVIGMSGNGGDPAGSNTTGKDKFAFDPYFAKEYLEEHQGKTLYLVRQTLGDIGIYDMPTTGSLNWTWQPDIDIIPSGCNSMCVSLMTKLKNALLAAKKNGVTLIPIAILWHQGEHDAQSQTAINAYKQNLSNLISWMRGILSSPTLPFITAYIIGTYSTLSPQINSIFEEMVLLDRYMKCVDMTSYYSQSVGDGLHYNATALEYMGEQMYNFYKSFE